MKKEILVRVMIDGNKIGSIIQKNGFDESLSSQKEIISWLYHIAKDEDDKLRKKMETTMNYTIKEPYMNDN